MSDWSTRITDLEAKGWSLKAIGEEIGLSTSSVSDIKRGATLEPRGMAAVRLHELHLRLIAEAEDAPEPHRPGAAGEGDSVAQPTDGLTAEAA